MFSGNRVRFSAETEDEFVDDKIQQNSAVTPKRSTRIRNKPKKYGDIIELTPTKRRSLIEYESSEEDEVERSCTEKPTALFFSDDVDGQDIFKFKSRHSKNDLKNIVKTAVSNSPIMTPTKAKNRLLLNATEATPRHVTDIMKKRIKKEVASESSESDFSDGSSSDFVPDKSDDESESSAPETAEDEEGDTDEDNEKMHLRKPQKVQIVKKKDNRTRPKDSEYVVTPDNYFLMHSSKKITTSDNTLARLKNMNLNDEKETIYISEEHKHKIADLVQSYEHLFDRWLYVLSENFNVILYGVGSKRGVLHQFQAQKLKDLPCIVINGFFPSLTIRSILETIVIDLLENARVPSNVSDTIDLIDSQLSENCVDLFLIVHNIDGSMLRNSKSQSVLATLAQLRNVHMIATIDHINAPLLWDHSKLSKFKWTWWDVSTFVPYVEETSYESSLLARQGGALQLASLASVHRSLTTNARGIYNIIVQYQLDNQKQANYQGLPFKDLYLKAREQFLVSSDLALRAQLTEFLDHKLVKFKRIYDGSENLIIPIENTLLQQFVEQQGN